eukprot:5503066-Pyramimonas_sp.AAC.1
MVKHWLFDRSSVSMDSNAVLNRIDNGFLDALSFQFPGVTIVYSGAGWGNTLSRLPWYLPVCWPGLCPCMAKPPPGAPARSRCQHMIAKSCAEILH